MVRVPEDDVFIILLNNCSDQPLLQSIAKKIMAIIYQRPYFVPEKPVTLSDKELHAFAGIYGEEENRFFEVRLINRHLFGIEQPGEKMMLELFPMKNNTLKFIGEGEEEKYFEFTMNENNQPVELIATTPRGKLTLKKIR
jgi:hypothetical protein